MFFIINKLIKKIKRKVKEFNTHTVSRGAMGSNEGWLQWAMGAWGLIGNVKVGGSGQWKVKGWWDVWGIGSYGQCDVEGQ